MTEKVPLRSVSFDTSFLLKDNSLIDTVIGRISKDAIPSFITSTVISELEQLKIWGRISSEQHKMAIHRWKKTNGKIIDFKNRFLSDVFAKECIYSMKVHHGVSEKDIANDCNILVSTLKNGVDVFLSEDFHFTSKITQQVIDEVANAACKEYHQMCGARLYAVDASNFYRSYSQGSFDVSIAMDMMQSIRKPGKNLL
jgi:rRNA-processing protein FCF1